MDSKSWLLIGASRGLGAEFAKVSRANEVESKVTIVSRKEPGGMGPQDVWLKADLSKGEDQDQILQQTRDCVFSDVVYFAGGGPFGLFHERDWKDHRWALEVTFLFAARLTHELLRSSKAPKSLTFVGSSVAEDGGDRGASSYAAAKAALRSFYETLVSENLGVELRLFSPGYMNTALLPKNSQPRQQTIWEPAEVAGQLYDFIAKGPANSRRQLSPYPP